ncbi:MAG: hypothetical protein PSV36_10590 [Algoriphagus sp.]|nr:hypothetical protein [Algoriphagus sp.]
MQEDKTTKWLAAELRKKQEESPLPYELGAWEAFEKKRIDGSGKKAGFYWLSGIAASLAILFIAGGLWLSRETESGGRYSLSEQTALEENTLSQEPIEEKPTIAAGENTGLGDSPALASVEKLSSENQALNAASNSSKQVNSKSISDTKSIEEELNPVKSLVETDQKISEESISKTNLFPPTQIAPEGKAGMETSQTEVPEKVIASLELPKEPQYTEEEIKEILKTKSFATIVMGLSPGFGAAQGPEQTTSGASLGLGVMVDMDIIGKLAMGSGVALNYLNQASESQNYAQIAGFASPVTEKNEIAQVQVDIPLYFKYPVNRSRSISVQAGFSNLVTFNQYAEQQSTYTRQVAVLDANAAGSNSFTLKSESVNQSAVLEVPQNRFYPFATANFGVNIKLFESKKTKYEVMPFYNYPLQEFSGYGEKLGMFGASFKVNFGGAQKK